MASPLLVQSTRGRLVESEHRVACVVAASGGQVVARAGTPPPVTWWRSAAKPFQALPLLLDGAADRFDLTSEDLAIACASHSSEPGHLDAVDRFMARVGVGEADLACGPHPPLSGAVHRALWREGKEPTARWSNCSGKHTGMLALARHHGWPLSGYQRAGHPVQSRILEEVARWTGQPPGAIQQSVDGCAAVCFGLPLEAMALAWARFGHATDAGPRRLREAMLAHPWLVAGTGRPCTAIMEAWPGQVLAKIGAEGVYGASLPAYGLGVALKVEDGDMRASAVALVEILYQVAAWLGGPLAEEGFASLADWREAPIRNTRGEVTGVLRAAGSLVFSAPSGGELV